MGSLVACVYLLQQKIHLNTTVIIIDDSSGKINLNKRRTIAQNPRQTVSHLLRLLIVIIVRNDMVDGFCVHGTEPIDLSDILLSGQLLVTLIHAHLKSHSI